jgi:type IV pilus biogenesis protein PilP
MFKNSRFSAAAAIVAGLVSGLAAAQTAPKTERPASAAQAASAASPVNGAATPAEFKLKAPAEHGRGTIATITDLAQQLKVEQLKRDVREAKKEQGGGMDAASMRAGGSAFGMPPPAIPVSMKAPVSEKQPPSVVAILGLGGRLRARLADGRDLLAGQEASGWTVKSITPSSVSFEHCASDKGRSGKAETTCISRTVSPVAM